MSSGTPSIPGYELKRQIGRGGSATVYLARELKHDRLVAVKVLHEILAASIQAERFLREISIIAKLAHPNILPLLDSGRIDDVLYYVTPYVPGESLRGRLAREKRLDPEDAVRLTREVADALDYAHRQGLVHRDVKPENILLADGHALIADFGIARALVLAAEDGLTTAGLAVGTVRYMSPEQALGLKVDQRTDIYSLGCVLYEMLTGAAPASAEDEDSSHSDRESRAAALRRQNLQVPVHVLRALNVALDKQPSLRFATAAAMSAELDGRVRSSSHLLQRLRRTLTQQPLAAMAVVTVSATALVLVWSRGALPGRLRGVRPDTTRLAVFPAGNQAARQNSRAQAGALYEAIAGWRGLNLVDQFQTTDALERLNQPLTVRTARRLAASLGAGRFVLVRSEQVADSVRLEAALYDGAGRALYRLSDVLAADAASVPRALARTAQRLLLRGATADSSNAFVAGSSSLPAVQAFARGQDSLSRWNLDEAEKAFEEALNFDVSYARANLWLAQVKAWRGRLASDWYKLAERAASADTLLSQRERLLASALVLLSEGKFDAACRTYDQLRNTNDRDFGAWYGLGQCRSMDHVAVPDRTSPSSWRMRSSYQAAVTAYQRALELLPSAYAGYEHEKFEGLRNLLLVRKTGLVFARAAAPDTARFWARTTLLSDTLVLIPYPWSVVALGGSAAVPPGFAEAQASRTAYFRRLTTGWSSAFPQRAGPKHAVALALELSGDPHAIDTLMLASRLAKDAKQKVRLAAAEILLRVKFGTSADLPWWRGIWKSADSLLRAVQPTAELAAAMTPIAALLGRCDAATLWSGLRTRPTLPPMSQTLVDAADLHVVRASLGCAPGEKSLSLPDLAELAARDLQTADADDRQFVTAMVLQRPALLAWPVDAGAISQVADHSADPLVHAALAFARGDSAAAREAMALFEARYVEAIGTVSDVGYPAARLHLALGDTASAVVQLERTLHATRGFDPGVMDDPVITATLVRSMALRSAIARARDDAATARRWAGIVSILWSSADRELLPEVRRLHAR